MKSTDTTASHLALAPAYRTWLDHLRILYPIRGVLHIGAGTGASACLYEEWGVPNVAYIEADESRLARLTDATKNHAGWTAHGELLSDRSCETIFYRASNLNESGLLVPEDLSPLWRNLKSLEQQKLPTTTIEAFLESGAQGIVATDFNWVHVDCLPSLAILRGAGEFLGEWDVVIARALMNEGLLQGGLEIGKQALERFMAEHGYVCVAHAEERHPAIGQVLFVRNWRTDLQRQLKALRMDLERKEVGVQAQLDQLGEERDEQRRLTEKTQSEAARLAKERDEQKMRCDSLQAQIGMLSKARDEEKKRKEELHSRLSEIIQEHEQEQRRLIGQYQEEIGRLRRKQDDRVKQLEEINATDGLRNHFDNEIKKAIKTLQDSHKTQMISTSKQMEAFFRVQNYIGRSFPLPEMHGWPVSPDFGWLLIDIIEGNCYDAVIEFGSGTSTILIAKALSKSARGRGAKPAPLMSFEHLKDYYRQTNKNIRKAKVRKIVQLKYAPLVKYSIPKEGDFLYYHCERHLKNLRRSLDKKQPNVFVVVDGPPEDTCYDARFPALTMLFENFEKASFDVLIDDYERDGERRVVKRWIDWLASRKINADVTQYIELEKQACLISFSTTDF